MPQDHLWIEGISRSGKTGLLVDRLQNWDMDQWLVLTTETDQKRQLSERLTKAPRAIHPWQGWLKEMVLLFFPLLATRLGLSCQSPIVLRVEKEQELAYQVWLSQIQSRTITLPNTSGPRLVRRLLDIYFLAVNNGYSLDNLGPILARETETPLPIEAITVALGEWRSFCWQKGLLTYTLISELFAEHLLELPQFQTYCQNQFTGVAIDDADELPALASRFTQLMITWGINTLITYNPDGEARWGLGASARAWLPLRQKCQIVSLDRPQDSLAIHSPILCQQIVEPMLVEAESQLPLILIQEISRSTLLRTTANYICTQVRRGQIEPQDIAIIAPGLEAIARYTFTEIFQAQGLPILPMVDQRPLNLSVEVRALLTLLALQYPQLGRLIRNLDMGEMFTTLMPEIDPVRADLLEKFCFAPSLSRPQLQDVTVYADWYRFGHRVTALYRDLRKWLEANTALQPLLFLDRAIQHFYQPQNLSYGGISALKMLMETAQHHWKVSQRLEDLAPDHPHILETFIDGVRRGIVTANPYPPNLPSTGIMITNIFQYRMARSRHRWQFWLDIGSDFWQEGGSAILFTASLFRSDWTETQETEPQERLRRIIQDLLCRCTEKIFLCDSDIDIKGNEQSGILSALGDLATTLGHLD